jgi:hypothetical protein
MNLSKRKRNHFTPAIQGAARAFGVAGLLSRRPSGTGVWLAPLAGLAGTATLRSISLIQNDRI